MLSGASPSYAIETGTAPQLPPPPPPPLTAPAPTASATQPAGTATAPSAKRPASAKAAARASDSKEGTRETGVVGVSADGAASDTGATAGPHALDTRWFVAPMLGYASDYLDFGIGIRGGKTLDNHVYVGGTFLYQVGEGGSYSATVTGPTGPMSTSVSWGSSGFYLGPEGGYDFDLKYVVLRPYLGIGLFSWTASASGPAGGGSATKTQFVVWPGCSVIYDVRGTNFFVGGDVRLVSVPGTSFGFYALGGVHFDT
jgi:hypothetical protein